MNEATLNRWDGTGRRVGEWSPDLCPTATRVLLALLDVYGRDGRATVRTVAFAAGVPSTSTTQKYLLRLRSAGLVSWDDHRSGTLRPLVAVVAGGAS